MRDKLVVFVMEEPDGRVAVQLFGDPKQVENTWDNLTGKVGDPESRATLIKLDYGTGTFEVCGKSLPVKQTPPDERPDGYRLGEGPIFFDKKPEKSGD